LVIKEVAVAGGPSSEASLKKQPSDLVPAEKPPRPVVFHVHGVSKTYRVGKVVIRHPSNDLADGIRVNVD